ncbi:hypothetical protein INQ45_06580 [Flavobacterium columnare]|uniref:hypothetical protein n=1 Tax=Flavobacterium columnare TaxID=996 RepID=UPI002D211230|nr:hypothetical protein [Flavobacterium columnare]MEB3800746.1 hypothetical protein [Flavobacterium columnare]
MKNIITLLFFVFAFGISNAQNDNPYAKFGYMGNKLKTPQERLNFMLVIPNKDSLSVVKKLGIESKLSKYYLIDKDDKVILEENIYKEQLARFLSVDPLAKNYPWNSTYAFAENDVLRSIDLEGLEKLIVHNINSEERTANMTIKKTALVVMEGINSIPQHSNFSSEALNSLFKRGDRTLFFQNLPQNGVESQFVERSNWRNGSAYKIDVNYDININFVTSDEANRLIVEDPILYSKVSMGLERFFPNNNNPAKAESTGNRNQIMFSPLYVGNSPTGPMGTVGEQQYPTANELLGHELGTHNMAGHQHPEGVNEKTAEYNSPGLKGAVPGNIYPLKEETQEIINTNKNNIEVR